MTSFSLSIFITSETVHHTSCEEVHELPESYCDDNHWRAHCFHDYIYIFHPSCFNEI